MNRRVVVTGMGVVSPLGNNMADTWSAMKQGKSGISTITAFDASEGYSCTIAGEVKNFDASAVITPKDAKRMDRFIQLGLVATHEALEQAGLAGEGAIKEEDSYRYGTALGSGIGGFPLIEETHKTLMEKGPRRVSPFFIPAILVNLISGHVSMRYNTRGPNISHVSACATSAHALGEAAEMIRRGAADVMVAGGAESTVCPLAIAGFGAMRALSTGYNDSPEKASRPFDKDRDGFVLGEGAATLILEEYEHAKARGATILAELKGYGLSGDAYHLSSPDPDHKGSEAAMRMALQQAGIDASEVGYVNAHATSTPAGDEIESKAIESVFGPNVLVSATKSMSGHLLGAAGGFEAAISIMAMREGILPPTINLDNLSESCNLDYIANTAREVKVDNILSNSFGFGGTNAALVFGKAE
tara:strand:- start:401306 stop:402553 length:1248 start_codon:yes stop_codon:yes gene_type:complete